jgi:glycosyltransferase involved in cell wall biosynthesis
MERNEPVLVTVLMLTYRHAHFIGQALEGVLAQQCGFCFELLIGDDHSQDGTRELVTSIIDSHPMGHTISYTCHEEQIGISPNLRWALARAKGRYIALCEGDDYWTDPLKLAQQVEFLEANPSYSLTCGGYQMLHMDSGQMEHRLYGKGNFSFGLADLETEWLTKTLTVVFRKELLMQHDLHKYKYLRDTHMTYLLLSQGPGYYFHRLMGCYRVHPGGVSSMASHLDKYRQLYHSFRELHMHHSNTWIRRKYEKTLFRYYQLVTAPSGYGHCSMEAILLICKVLGKPRYWGRFIYLHYLNCKAWVAGTGRQAR